jgi:predicted nucleic acid-binding protein
LGGWLKIKRVNRHISFDFSLHACEIEVINLAGEMEIKTVIIDDAKARSAAEIARLSQLGTLRIILQAVKNNIMGFDECRSNLEDNIDSGFYIKDNVYIRVIRPNKKF